MTMKGVNMLLHKYKGKSFQGTTTEYRVLHYWVEKTLGKPNLCEECGKTEGRFEWANVSGEYRKEVNDWIRLCHKCHRYMDNPGLWNREYCDKGHRLTISNIYMHHRSLECKNCNRNNLRKHRMLKVTV